MFDSNTRRRRRRIIWPLIITFVVAVGVLVATAGGDARSTIAHLEEVQTTALQISRAGSALRGLVGDLSRVDRSEFDSVLSGVTQALDGAEEVANREPPDQELLGAMSLYRLAVESWRTGIDGFREAALRAADDPTDESVVDDIASAVVSVRAGDALYQALLVEFAREDVPSPVAEMPSVQLLPVDAPITVLAPAWVSAIRSETSGLPMRPSIRIEQVSTTPEWVQSSGGGLVVPAVAETIDLMVVIGNSGNTVTEPATVTLTFQGQGLEPVTQEQTVDAIQAGANTTVGFRDLEVVPGTFYELIVELRPGGADAFADDNRYSTGFLVNEATPSTDTTAGG
ncbi:MAG TPA: hypothetical protein VK070_12730 [Acidimicrobiia bacterium]|nr:hypothetical protein [Acidimicrobiia bacterium]